MTSVLDLLGRSRNPEDLKLGVEIERYGFDSKQNIIRYPTHIRALFQEMIAEHGWKIAYEANGNVLAIEKEGDQWSLEPGSQLELSASPCKSLVELEAQQLRREKELLSMKAAQGWRWEFLGINPYESPEEIKIIPSPRYQIMTDYFTAKGGRGLEMMRLTSGCHVNLDYWCPEHAIKLLRVGAYIAPVFVALFANSPFIRRKRAEAFSERTMVWQSVDPLRSGVPEFFFSKSASIGDYVNLVESTPLMFVYNEKAEPEPAKGRRLIDLPESIREKNVLPGIRQLFFDVRLKPCCVELRYLDQNNEAVRLSSFALMLGLLQDQKNLESLNEEALKTTAKEVSNAIVSAARSGLNESEIYERSKRYLKLAEEGIQRRNLNELKFLSPAEEIVRLRKNPAQRLLEGGDFVEYQKSALRR